MNCEAVRDQLLSARSLSAAATDHLDSCPTCAEFANRFEAVRGQLSERAEVIPDAFFASRVAAIVGSDSELIGWAAWKILPATLALALVLSAWCLLATPGPTDLVELAPTDDVLAWAMEERTDP